MLSTFSLVHISYTRSQKYDVHKDYAMFSRYTFSPFRERTSDVRMESQYRKVCSIFRGGYSEYVLSSHVHLVGIFLYNYTAS